MPLQIFPGPIESYTIIDQTLNNSITVKGLNTCINHLFFVLQIDILLFLYNNGQGSVIHLNYSMQAVTWLTD